MANLERQQTVQTILQNLRTLDGLKRLFWQELNYDHENKPLSPRQWPDGAQNALADDPVLFASGGEDNAFHIVYCRLNADSLQRGLERPIVNQLIREHPYCLFVFSDTTQSAWHFLNIKYDENAEKRRLFRRITVQAGGGLRTAAERLQMLDLAAMGVPATSRRGVQNLMLPPAKPAGSEVKPLSPLEIQKRHDEAFDVESVTKAFYEELANWYFWAREHAVFPKDAPVDADGKPSLSLIRLITRLIFCWFLREKRNPQTGQGLLPDALFDERHIRFLLKDSSPESCTYYTAILQNLFFATLNTEMDKQGQPPNRRFIDEGNGRQSDDHMVHTFWRNAEQLNNPKAFADLLRGVPFLNGGLFECLDDRVPKGNSSYTMEVRVDGFSTDPKKQPKIPNFLFFGPDRIVDLSSAYNDTSRNHENSRPLLSILHRYNFTLTENTPLEQEVALDPELLGDVFENLLAAYNPETGMVARKATGSFYTPRVVVDWMVDQALTVYLTDVLPSGGTGSTPSSSVPSEHRLRRLLSWEEDGHDFSAKETENLIDAIDRMKALDPACGSGAFPMGLLQKLVHVLKKLDPDNKGWRRRQEAALEAFDSATAHGERLRTYLSYATRPQAVLDFGDTPVFTSIAYPAILVTQKTWHVEYRKLPKALKTDDLPSNWQSKVFTWSPGPSLNDFPEVFEMQASTLAQRDLRPDGWRLESPVKLRLLERLRKAGTPLGGYVKGRFYYGIKTGLNEAFVVDRATRDRLIAEHPSSAEILKPFLRGRDVKRWRCEPQDLWLIFTRRGCDIKKYPAIHEHLSLFKKRLMPGAPGGRKPGSYEWYEIQDNIAYWQEFEQPKIVVLDERVYRLYGLTKEEIKIIQGEGGKEEK